MISPTLRTTLGLCTLAALGGAMRPERMDATWKMAKERGLAEVEVDVGGSRAVQDEPDRLLEKFGLDEADAKVIKSPNMLFFSLAAVGVLAVAMVNSVVSGLMGGGRNFSHQVVHSLKRILLVVGVVVHVLICYAGTYKSHLHEDLGIHHEQLSHFVEFCTMIHKFWTEIIFVMAITWVAGTYIQEAHAESRAPVQDQEVFTANDIYANATESMFAVSVRFLFQTCLLLILVFVAEAGWRNAPQDVPLWRKCWNVVISIALQLYMFNQAKGRDAWQELRRLRTVRSMQVVSEGEGKDAPEVCHFTAGDYYVRLAMSVVANGLFHKFVLLSYPIFIFGYIGNADMLGIVKDMLALVFVMEIDNLNNPVSFRATSVVS